ncbi:Fe-S cluster assembly sulfur transfer protein SufU [Konateibacter massiliensis]|uniref:Fe-S cluster assembly sulfur transfer protein SufU n=1 Tax=Konateibacter massiliensis TaxID=2002841 RepID=UPI000C15A6EE|nr:SUF system NifU family Fe-S cluster assembly protein [Konateibacter massiliensis]
MELDELYTDLILEYSQSNTHRKPLIRPNYKMRGVNPSCGDNIELELNVENGMIKEVGLLGNGCAISQASAAMMAELIEGKTVEEAKQFAKTFIGMIQKTVTDEEALEVLEEARAFQNISNMPARVKCAVLSWHTLEEALEKEE